MSEHYTAGIFTLGCKVNQYESEAMAEELRRLGVVVLPPTEICDLYLINTCTVTAESDRKARQFIRRAISRNPDAAIVVTGCLAQTAPESLTAIAGVDLIVGNTQKCEAARAGAALLFSGTPKTRQPKILVESTVGAGFEPMQITSFERTRAYVKIEDGCESHCTYCIIPSARGDVRSKPVCEVIREITGLCEGGCREIVLTGIETASYGRDLPEGADLASLLEEIDRIPGIGRVRISSLDPSLIRPDFVRRISPLHSLAPHFHLSLQSGSDRTLAAMKRKYNARMARDAMELLRRNIPDVKFTTDIIVGFPGEEEEDFLATVDFVRDAGFLHAHIFPYSKRKGTPAAVMPNQVPEEEKTRRLHLLSEVAAEGCKRILAQEVSRGRVCDVLFESMEGGYAYGHSADFLEVAIPADTSLHAQLFPVRLCRTDGKVCYGEIVAGKT